MRINGRFRLLSYGIDGCKDEDTPFRLFTDSEKGIKVVLLKVEGLSICFGIRSSEVPFIWYSTEDGICLFVQVRRVSVPVCGLIRITRYDFDRPFMEKMETAQIFVSLTIG